MLGHVAVIRPGIYVVHSGFVAGLLQDCISYLPSGSGTVPAAGAIHGLELAFVKVILVRKRFDHLPVRICTRELEAKIRCPGYPVEFCTAPFATLPEFNMTVPVI
jgi:hypothetical protein